MKIAFIEIGEPLPMEGNVRLHFVGTISRNLVELGHEVTWWTSSFSHAKKQHLVTQDTTVSHSGVKLKIISGLGYSRNVSIARIRHQKHFAARCFEEMCKSEKPDVVVACVPTIDGAETATKYGKKFGIPVVVSIRDLWPDELLDLAPRVLRSLAKLILNPDFNKMRTVCSAAAGIVGISETYLQYGLSFSGRQATKLDREIPLGYSASKYDEAVLQSAKEWWQQKSIVPGRFICCFFGTIGRFFDLGTVIEVARSLQGRQDIQFVLCGDGSRLAEYTRQANGIKNVIFPGWVDEPKIQSLMSMASLGLAPYKVGVKMALPNKPFEYLCGGLPVVSSIQGDLQKILSDNDCGLTYRADSTVDLRNAIVSLVDDRTRSKQMGKNGIRLFQNKYSAIHVAKEWSEYLSQIVHAGCPN